MITKQQACLSFPHWTRRLVSALTPTGKFLKSHPLVIRNSSDLLQLRPKVYCRSISDSKASPVVTSDALLTTAKMTDARYCYPSLRIFRQGSQAVVQPAVDPCNQQGVETLYVNLSDGKVSVSQSMEILRGNTIHSLGLFGICKLHKGKQRATGMTSLPLAAAMGNMALICSDPRGTHRDWQPTTFAAPYCLSMPP